MVVTEKPNKNFTIPEPLLRELEELGAAVNGKQKWLINAAALLALLELTDAERSFYYAQIVTADMVQGGYGPLIASAKSGKLREDAARQSMPAVDTTGVLTREGRRRSLVKPAARPESSKPH